MKTKKNIKDSVFRMLFKDKKDILELYNAISGGNYTAETEVELKTLDNAIFADIKNDLAFTIDNKFIVLIEHQSTVNPNMPARMLCYIAREYEEYLQSGKMYSKYTVPLPTPEMYVFYNGVEEQPLEQEIKLSDAFKEKCAKISLEAVVKVINVNHENRAKILEKSKLLAEYSEFIYTIRHFIKEGKDMDAAIEESIRDCISRGVLKEFLKRNGGEIVSFLFEALTTEECIAIREADGYRKGMEEGHAAGVREGAEKERIEIAKNLKKAGIPMEIIAENTGLPIEEIEKL